MTNSVTRRVHIVPQGYEDDRIVLPAKIRDAEIVILIGHNDESEIGEEVRSSVKAKLEEHEINVETDQCDIFDLNDSLETILSHIRGRNDQDVISINISAGSKISAIAGMLACMFTSASPYYVIPEGYKDSTDDSDRRTVSYGVESIEDLPAYPFTEPDLQLIRVLEFISNKQPQNGPDGVVLKEIGEFLLEHNLPAVHGSEVEPGEADKIYPMVNDKILVPLLKRRLISKTPYKGAVHVRTTEDGEEMREVAESLLGGNRPE